MTLSERAFCPHSSLNFLPGRQPAEKICLDWRQNSSLSQHPPVVNTGSYCVESWHDAYCIPELPQQRADISEEFLRTYQRNFRVIVFDTPLGKTAGAYREKVAFQALRPVPETRTKREWDFVMGGRPIWIMGIPERPNSIAGIEKPALLLQVKEGFRFPVLPAAPKQANPFAPGGRSLFPWYDLFVSNRVYFWGVQQNGTERVYISVQRP